MDKLPAWSLQPKATGVLYAFFRKPWDSRQTSIPLNTSSESEGRAIAPSLIETYLKKNDPRATTNIIGGKCFKDYLNEHIKDKYIGKKDNTVRSAKGACRRFIEQIGVEKISDLTWPMFRDYIEGRKITNGTQTIYNILISLRVFFEDLVERKVMEKNLAMDYPLPSSSDFAKNEITWGVAEFHTFLDACVPEDKKMYWVIWHTGMDMKDYFFMRRKHILMTENGPVISMIRSKATSADQRILFPLEHSPAKKVIMDAWALTSSPEDRLFAREYSDKQYETYNFTCTNRRTRLWQRLWPLTQPKTVKQIRHTFVTECINGRRFGQSIPYPILSQWAGWSPGSTIGLRYYTHLKAGDTASAMLPRMTMQAP